MSHSGSIKTIDYLRFAVQRTVKFVAFFSGLGQAGIDKFVRRGAAMEVPCEATEVQRATVLRLRSDQAFDYMAASLKATTLGDCAT